GVGWTMPLGERTSMTSGGRPRSPNEAASTSRSARGVVMETVSATAIPSKASPATATVLTWTGFVHRERTTVDVFAVQILDGPTCFLVGHFDKTEPPRPAGVPVGDDRSRLNGSILTEKRLERTRVVRVRQIAYVDVDGCS